MVGFLQRNTNVKENLKLLKHEKKVYFTVFTQPVFVNLLSITFYLSSSFFLGVAAFFANLCVDFVLTSLEESQEGTWSMANQSARFSVITKTPRKTFASFPLNQASVSVRSAF